MAFQHAVAERTCLMERRTARLWVGLMGLPVEIELQHIHPGFTEGAESSAPIEHSGSHMTDSNSQSHVDD